jgi:hypothetical protein
VSRLEKDLESDITDFAEVRGWWSTKYVAPARRGVPDRIFIRRGRTVFIEVKKLDEEAKIQQERVHREMRAHGAEVHVVDNIEDARRILR